MSQLLHGNRLNVGASRVRGSAAGGYLLAAKDTCHGPP